MRAKDEHREISGTYRINYTVDVTVAVTVTPIFSRDRRITGQTTDKVNAVSRTTRNNDGRISPFPWFSYRSLRLGHSNSHFFRNSRRYLNRLSR